MTLTPELITAIGSSIVAALSAAAAYRTSQRNARKDEVELLRSEVARLHAKAEEQDKRIEEYEREVLFLRRENTWLKTVLKQRGIDVPPMPEDWAK